jgi:hypothetical protein
VGVKHCQWTRKSGGAKFQYGKTYEKKKKSLQTMFGFHAKNAAYSTFWWNKKWGDQTHGFATPSFKEWGAYATLARARTHLHIEMDM